MKWCRRCQVVKPVSEFRKNAAVKDGLQTYCNSCAHEYATLYVAARKPERQAQAITKQCPTCEAVFETSRSQQRYCSADCRCEGERRARTRVTRLQQKPAFDWARIRRLAEEDCRADEIARFTGRRAKWLRETCPDLWRSHVVEVRQAVRAHLAHYHQREREEEQEWNRLERASVWHFVSCPCSACGKLVVGRWASGGGPDEHGVLCTQCSRAHGHQRRSLATVPKPRRQPQRCGRCSEVRPAVEFDRPKGAPAWCLRCRREWSRDQGRMKGHELTRASAEAEQDPDYLRWYELYTLICRAEKGRLGVSRLRSNHTRAVQKLVLVLMLGGKCRRCGYKGNLIAMDFDHIDPRKKVRDLSRINVFSRAFVEAKKCQVLCSNCHRLRLASRVQTEVSAYLRAALLPGQEQLRVWDAA
jgi:hypothetical protein